MKRCEFCKGENGTEVATGDVSELLDPSNDQEPMRLYRTRAAKPTTQRGTEAEDGKKYCYFFLLFHGVNAAKGNAANRATLATPKVINLSRSRSGAAGSRGRCQHLQQQQRLAPWVLRPCSICGGGLDGDAAAAPAPAAASAAWMDRQREELNAQVHKVANELMQRIIAYCDVHHKRRSRDERVTVKDVWNCMLLYYNVRDSFHGNNGKETAKVGRWSFSSVPICTTQRTVGRSVTTTPNPTRTRTVETILTKCCTKTTVKTKMKARSVCSRSACARCTALVNQSVVSSVVPLRITRPEAIFEHFGGATNAATKAKIFAAIRGVHLPLAVASDHQDYKDIIKTTRVSVWLLTTRSVARCVVVVVVRQGGGFR